MNTLIYHNPRCSKSRQTLALLLEKGITPEIVEYLETPPDAPTLSSILQQLGLEAHELIRTGEDEYKNQKDAVADMDAAQLVAWMIEHPKVIERPIVVTAIGARIGRPPESVLEIID
jgi:arsenate reductase